MSRYMKKYGNKFTAFHNLIGTDSPVVVEIGAHYGEDSLRFLEMFTGIKLYCFEPDPRNIQTFKYASSAIDVAAERFDNWYAQTNLGKIDLIWIDVQGAEREVVDGMGVEIKNVKYLWIEYGESTYEGAMTRSETVELFGKKGFDVLGELSDTTPSGDIMFYNRELK